MGDINITNLKELIKNYELNKKTFKTSIEKFTEINNLSEKIHDIILYNKLNKNIINDYVKYLTDYHLNSLTKNLEDDPPNNVEDDPPNNVKDDPPNNVEDDSTKPLNTL